MPKTIYGLELKAVGLTFFNPETESFVHFRADNASLTSNFIGVLLSDPIGGILVQTSDSLGFNHIIRRSDSAPLNCPLMK